MAEEIALCVQSKARAQNKADVRGGPVVVRQLHSLGSIPDLEGMIPNAFIGLLADILTLAIQDERDQRL
jgi:hypothetical protein